MFLGLGEAGQTSELLLMREPDLQSAVDLCVLWGSLENNVTEQPVLKEKTPGRRSRPGADVLGRRCELL